MNNKVTQSNGFTRTRTNPLSPFFGYPNWGGPYPRSSLSSNSCYGYLQTKTELLRD